MTHNLLVVLITFLVLAFDGSAKDVDQITSLLSPTTPTPKLQQTLGAIDQKSYLVTKVIDGDTIEIETGQKVRYIGIDTPELKGSECFAKEAKEKNNQLVGGKRVKIQKDVSETDRYGRLLRFVYTENGEFVNDILVKEGFAFAATFPPDVARQEQFLASQQKAIASNQGLWKAHCNNP